MAFIGLRKPVVGKMKDDGSYEEPFAFGKAIGMQVNPSYSEGSLNADDEQVEYDKEFNYADVTLNTSTIPINAHGVMFGHKVEPDTESEKKTVTFNKDDQQNYVGVGWVSVEKVDGVRSYVSNFLAKVKFSEPNDDYATKGDSIEYKTPSISGRAYPNAEGMWKKTQTCASESEAIEFINKMFGVTGE